MACRGALPRGQVPKASETRRVELMLWNLGRKKSPRRGPLRHKEGSFRRTAFCLKEIGKIFAFLKTPTPGCGETKVLRIYIVRERRTFDELSPPK